MSDSSGLCIWLTGRQRAGKTTLARELLPLLGPFGRHPVILDEEDLRRYLDPASPSPPGRDEQIAKEATYVGKLLVDNGLDPVVALNAPHASDRARARIEISKLVEVYVTTPLYVCEARRRRSQANGQRSGAPGSASSQVEESFEPPEHAEIQVGTLDRTPRQSAEWVLRELRRLGWIAEAGRGSGTDSGGSRSSRSTHGNASLNPRPLRRAALE